jgi:molybdopterin/thiamine biosynthesis adenylyltransferase
MDAIQIRGRFKDAPWFPKEQILCVIGGAGGIGSWLAFLLARTGFYPLVYDFDTVEVHNLGGQLFNKKHIGMPKVEAVKELVLEFSDMDIMVFDEKYDEESMTSSYMFSAFDNMEARKIMFKRWREDNVDNPNAIFIDGRLLMEQMQIFCVTPQTANEYEMDHLFNDSEVQTENCTLKQTSHSASMIASLMIGFFTNHLTNVNKGEKIRDVPFSHEYFIPLNLIS